MLIYYIDRVNTNFVKHYYKLHPKPPKHSTQLAIGQKTPLAIPLYLGIPMK
jgi:hypothetical protein